MDKSYIVVLQTGLLLTDVVDRKNTGHVFRWMKMINTRELWTLVNRINN